ncbi:esterase/lipase family protein [Glutamicibacter endophyticus]|uniref:esterase/lipase family protein n=1 Tax=Glutamicibacter endophyticus TaxID=1522174 RepID=UPI003AF1988D
MPRRFLASLAACALLSLGVLLPSSSAAASTDSSNTELQSFELSPLGANDWGCKPSDAHPYPVILVPGTFETMLKNWSTLSPVLKSQGYCVYSLNYGVRNHLPASGPIRESAKELADFVDRVRQATGARKVDLVGHSQGGMMPRWYLGFLGGAKYVNQLIGIAPSNHGTRGVLMPSAEGALLVDTASVICDACADQKAGSEFMQELNSIGDTVPGPVYTVITTKYDEVVTPYRSQFLAGHERQVTNLVLQDLCPLDFFEHDQTPNDPVVHRLVSHALAQQNAPADPDFQPNCGLLP